VRGHPGKPAPPLGYKIVFGGRRMPLRNFDARYVENGVISRWRAIRRRVDDLSGVGECEAWHEGFMPWLMDLEL